MPSSWKLDTKDGVVDLPKNIMIQQFLQKSMLSPKVEHEELVSELVDYLENSKVLSSTNALQLALLAFDTGYYYKVLLEKNSVEVTTTEDNDEPA